MDRSTLSSMSAVDAAVALRSLPRRFRGAFRPEELAGAPDAVDVTKPAPGGGRSPLELVLATVAALEALERAVHSTLVDNEPQLDPIVFDRDRRDAVTARGSLTDALDALTRVANEFATRVEHASARDWTRQAHVGDTRVTALDLLQEAVASARTYLDELERSLQEQRRGHK
jgi:hypothetical protein